MIHALITKKRQYDYFLSPSVTDTLMNGYNVFMACSVSVIIINYRKHCYIFIKITYP